LDDQTKLKKWLAGGLDELSALIENGVKVTRDVVLRMRRKSEDNLI